MVKTSAERNKERKAERKAARGAERETLLLVADHMAHTASGSAADHARHLHTRLSAHYKEAARLECGICGERVGQQHDEDCTLKGIVVDPDEVKDAADAKQAAADDKQAAEDKRDNATGRGGLGYERKDDKADPAKQSK